ncbi:MAG: hypothetical protein AABZ60_04260 [Planctomycetota bacterium]
MKLKKLSTLTCRETHPYWLILLCFLGFAWIGHPPIPSETLPSANPAPFYQKLYTHPDRSLDPESSCSYFEPSPRYFPWILNTFSIYVLFKMMRRRDNCGAFRLACISAFATPCFSQLNDELSPLNLLFLVQALLLYYLSGGGYRFRSYWIGFLLGTLCILHPGFFLGTFVFFHLLYVKEGKRFFFPTFIIAILTFLTLLFLLPNYRFYSEWDLQRDPLDTLWEQWFSFESGLLFYCPFLFFGMAGIVRAFKSDSTFHIYLILFLLGQMLSIATFPRDIDPKLYRLESLLLYPYLLVFLHLQWRLILQKKRTRLLFTGTVLFSLYFQLSIL